MGNEYKFVNPFNFMPLPKKVERGNDVSGRYTGVINYSLLTKTPLIIPNTSNDRTFEEKNATAEHKSYDFYSYTNLSNVTRSISDAPDRPIIPGSEIRGMFRANYEMLTESCMSSVNDGNIVSKRTHEIFSAGIIVRNETGTFDLYSAVEHMGRTIASNDLTDTELVGPNKYALSYRQKSLVEGQKVFFRHVDNSPGRSIAKNISTTRNNVSSEVGYIIKGEDGVKDKHVLHVFMKNKLIRTNIDIAILKKTLEEYKGYGEYKASFNLFKEGKGNSCFPVYYSVINESDSVFLSPAQITKEVYKRKIHEMIGENTTCDGKKGLCRACALFGIVGNNGLAKTSSVRFTDLEPNLQSNNYNSIFKKVITLAPLSAPKIKNMEFYLERPANAAFWTYDYYIDLGGKIHKNTYGINGRKFYWHNLKLKENDNKMSSQNYSVRPLREGVSFRGQMFFDDISKEELDTLIYLINCGDFADINSKKHGFKLGTAKPLGYGSVSVSVDSVILKKVIISDDGTIDRMLFEYDEAQTPEISEDVKNKFAKMTDFYALQGLNVDYPRLTEGGEVYKWYCENHSALKNNTKTKSPTSRRQEFYDMYMEPLSPDLKSTNKVQNRLSNNGLVKGQVYDAVVTRTLEWGVFINAGGINRGACIKGINHLNVNDKIRAKFVSERTTRNGLQEYIFVLVK